jgi:hypothetical protein
MATRDYTGSAGEITPRAGTLLPDTAFVDHVGQEEGTCEDHVVDVGKGVGAVVVAPVQEANLRLRPSPTGSN